VRGAVLNGHDVRNFKRWFPPGQRIEVLELRAAAT
jgi:hypothetical protein